MATMNHYNHQKLQKNPAKTLYLRGF